MEQNQIFLRFLKKEGVLGLIVSSNFFPSLSLKVSLMFQ